MRSTTRKVWMALPSPHVRASGIASTWKPGLGEGTRWCPSASTSPPLATPHSREAVLTQSPMAVNSCRSAEPM